MSKQEYCEACCGTGEISVAGKIVGPGVRDLADRRQMCDCCDGTGIHEPFPCAEITEMAEDLGIETTPGVSVQGEEILYWLWRRIKALEGTP